MDCLLIAMLTLMGPLEVLSKPKIKYTKTREHLQSSNNITDVWTSCSSKSLNITVSMTQPFKGVLFAKEFSQECRAVGSLSQIISVHLPTSGCGVRLRSDPSDRKMYYSVTIVLQQDKHLQQITDQEKEVKCYIDEYQLSLNSYGIRALLKNKPAVKHNNEHRSARMKKEDWSHNSTDIDENIKDIEEVFSASRAWIEIVPEKGNESRETLQVGETTLLLFKTTLPVGVDWKIVECLAHDGLGETSQKLLDDFGCPIDDLLLPKPLKGVQIPIGSMLHQEAVSKFAAFKFPDRDRLHISCGLLICRGKCKKVDCADVTQSEVFDKRKSRAVKGQEGELLDRIEIFNSVKVIAPSIDLEDYRQAMKSSNTFDSTIASLKIIPGDRTFCVSTDKMALTFCALGIIFLIAVVIAACALFRARRSRVEMHAYTRSLFSSSASGSAYGGSKLLLHESPCSSQTASRGISYGRIL